STHARVAPRAAFTSGGLDVSVRASGDRDGEHGERSQQSGTKIGAKNNAKSASSRKSSHLIAPPSMPDSDVPRIAFVAGLLRPGERFSSAPTHVPLEGGKAMVD